jgi:putative heme-binding domain-containing protein
VKLRLGDPDAPLAAATLLADKTAKVDAQLDLLQVLADQKIPPLQPVLLSLLERAGSDKLRIATLAALQMYDDSAIAERVIGLCPTLSGESLTAAQNLLSSRPAWAAEFVRSIEAGRIAQAAVPASIVAKLRLHRDSQLTASISRLWPEGSTAPASAAESVLKRLTAAVEDLASPGDPYRGHDLFGTSCAVCHRFFGEGGQIGPDLTGYQRNDPTALLTAIANPSGEIREGYENHTIVTRDGRTLVGFLAEQDEKVLALRGLDGSTTHVAVADIASRQASDRSLMPEGLLSAFEPQQVRDLVAYLRITQPLVPHRK